jgi:hypothetical protein
MLRGEELIPFTKSKRGGSSLFDQIKGRSSSLFDEVEGRRTKSCEIENGGYGWLVDVPLKK